MSGFPPLAALRQPPSGGLFQRKGIRFGSRRKSRVLTREKARAGTSVPRSGTQNAWSQEMLKRIAELISPTML
jgi:hypothetical protein